MFSIHQRFLTAALLTLLPAALVAADATSLKQHAPFYRSATTQTKPADSGSPVVVNAASYLPGICPGGLATIFGSNLSTVSGIVVATTSQLPFVLAGVSIRVNGTPAALLSVAYAGGQDQISFQVPFEAETGPGAALIEVSNDGYVVGSVQTDSYVEDPGIFTYQGYGLAIRNVDGSLVGASNPAFPGDVLIVYTTGLGPVSVYVADGDPAPGDPLAYTVDPFSAVGDGEPCRVLFSGLAPGYTGLYQLNIVLPSDLRTGNLDFQISTPYASSGIVKLPID